MHCVRESSWLSTIKVSANREICCQYTAIVRSSRVVLSYSAFVISKTQVAESYAEGS